MLALLFMATGVFVLFTINDYSELYLVRKFKRMTGDIPAEERIEECFTNYELASGAYDDCNACFSYTQNPSESGKTGAPDYCLNHFSDAATYYSDLNADGQTDACYRFTLIPCRKENKLYKERAFLILSSPSGYRVDDSFFGKLETDMIVDSLKGNMIYGRAPLTDTVNAPLLPVEVEFPSGKGKARVKTE
ncbi:MAG: hypothetical protein AB1458_13200 [Bacteroidota bacterium]